MFYERMGALHARVLSREEGQGTVEYVALMLLIAAVLAGVVTAARKTDGGGIAATIVSKLKETLASVGGK